MPDPLRDRLCEAATSFLDRAPQASESVVGASLNDRIASALVDFAAGENRLGSHASHQTGHSARSYSEA